MYLYNNSNSSNNSSNNKSNSNSNNNHKLDNTEKIEENDAKNEREEGEDCDADEIERFHGGMLTERSRCGKFNRAVLF